MKKYLPFENKILSGLKACGIDFGKVSASSPLGIAVSGGADSLSLLFALSSVFASSCLRVITVNHGIRSDSESNGDAAFVQTLCESLSVKCSMVKIPHGKISSLAEKHVLSVEALARKYRYEAFESFIEEENLLALCLAHNQNDQCETLLMRFLQGSGNEGMGGIERVRAKFIRPMLAISRNEIESYLNEKNQGWCTDSTNSDTKYLRNRIRNLLVPLLDENFSGWHKALLAASKKALADEDFLQGEAEKFLDSAEHKNSSVIIDRNSFFKLHSAIQRRVFFTALNDAGFGGRFPFRLFEETLSYGGKKSGEIHFENVCVSFDEKNLVIFLCNKKETEEKSGENFIESGFFFLIDGEGADLEIEGLSVRAGQVTEFQETGGKKLLLSAAIPFVLRSPLPGDAIKSADGKYKSLSEIFINWKIPESQKSRVIVVEEILSGGEASVKALIAFHLGFKNWIVE